MKVASPVGEFPYTVSAVRIERGKLVVDGRMGTWPARVEVGIDDARALVRVARLPLAVLAGALVAAAAARRAGTSGRGRRRRG